MALVPMHGYILYRGEGFLNPTAVSGLVDPVVVDEPRDIIPASTRTSIAATYGLVPDIQDTPLTLGERDTRSSALDCLIIFHLRASLPAPIQARGLSTQQETMLQ